MIVIQAVYADGVLTPREPLNLPEGSIVEIPLPASIDFDRQTPEEWLDAMMNRTPDQLEADRDRLRAKSSPARKPPDGKTVWQVIQENNPFEETDEEIRAMLEKLS